MPRADLSQRTLTINTAPQSNDAQRQRTTHSLWNIGFALAFFTMARGVLYGTDTPRDKEARAPLAGVAARCGR